MPAISTDPEPVGSRLKPVSAVFVSLALALLLGAETSLAQGFLPDAVNSFANSASGWTILTALIVWTIRGVTSLSALLGAVRSRSWDPPGPERRRFCTALLASSRPHRVRGFRLRCNLWPALAPAGVPSRESRSPPVDVPDFDAIYRADADPWRVRSSFYERRKLEVVLACLAEPTYTAAWDPACGVGELSARLGARADRVLATDASAEAVAISQTRTAEVAGVEVRHQRLPTPPPAGWPRFDLVALSEFFYYLDAGERAASLTMINAAAADRAELISLHWRHKPHDAYLSGADVQLEISAQLQTMGWQPVLHHEDRAFVLDTHDRNGS